MKMITFLAAAWVLGAALSLVTALLARETLGEQEILEVTGLPPAPELSTRPLAEVAAQRRRTSG